LIQIYTISASFANFLVLLATVEGGVGKGNLTLSLSQNPESIQGRCALKVSLYKAPDIQIWSAGKSRQ